MKMSQFRIALLIFVLTPLFVFGQETKTKEIKKHYTVSPTADLSIDGRYGDIHIETWAKNEVDVQIKIEVTNRSSSKAQQYLDNITIDIDDTGGDDRCKFIKICMS